MRLFIPELCLLLSSVKIQDNKVIAGWVENGYWYYVSTETSWFSYRDSPTFGSVDYLNPVTHWLHEKPISYIFVKSSLKGDYNEVIETVRDKKPLPKNTNFHNLLKEDDLKSVSKRGYKLSGFDFLDDDIPF